MSTLSHVFLIHAVACWLGVFSEQDCDSSSDCSVELLQISTSLVDNAKEKSHMTMPDSAGPLEQRPVFFMHGVGGYAGQFNYIIDLMRMANSTRKLIPIDILKGEISYDTPMYSQMIGVISYIRASIANDPTAFSNGYDLVGHSLGGVLVRAVAESMDDHNIKTLISLAGPQGGYYCTDFPCPFGAIYGFNESFDGNIAELNRTPVNFSEEDIAHIYDPEVQATSAFANVYRDIQKSKFLTGNVFLPVIDCLLDDDADNHRRKSNFLRLEHAIFAGGIGDLILPDPPASQFFEFFARNDSSTIAHLAQQQVYAQDTFGLRTMDADGRLSFIRAPGVGHGEWVGKESVILEYVLPLLGVTTTTTTSAKPHAPMHDSSVKSYANGDLPLLTRWIGAIGAVAMAESLTSRL